MDFAFWRRNKRVSNVTGSPASRAQPPVDDELIDRGDATRALRIRARRRFIGAAALLLAVVVLVPMLLDPEPRPLPDNIPVDIPSDKTPFSPRLSLPPVQSSTPAAPAQPSAAAVSPSTAAPAPSAKAAPPVGASASPPSQTPSAPAQTPKAQDADPRKGEARGESKVEEQRAVALLEGKGGDVIPHTSKDGRFVVQAAATASEVAARELSERLRRSGFAPYIERIQLKEGTRHRVRIGPYASRAEAERARAALATLGISANLVNL